MYQIKRLDTIAACGLAQFPADQFTISTDIKHPDAILLRSYDLHAFELPESVKAIGRAGAGVNNIPVEELTTQGIPVFNTPGANANAVKELTITGMLLACRHIPEAYDFTQTLAATPTNNQTIDQAIDQAVESQKKQFAGYELAGKTLAVLGLGAIGVGVANAALALGMEVIGFDPMIRVEQAWRLSAQVKQAGSLQAAIAHADFITVHVPLLPSTQHLLDTPQIQTLKKGAVILNLARHGIINETAICQALDTQHLRAYVCDFPNSQLIKQPGVINLPHLGASTQEAQDNCAIMIGQQVREYLQHGTITHAVNYPSVTMARASAYRIGIANQNIPNMVAQISACLAQSKINIHHLINQSQDQAAYTLIDIDQPAMPELINAINQINGVLKARYIFCEI